MTIRDVTGSLDVRLMRTLIVLVDESSVSRTAALLGQSQPTVSVALRRLRQITGDPLLVRSGSHLFPTERAVELRKVVGRAIQDIDGCLSNPTEFDEKTMARHFRIVAANSLGALLLPRLINRFGRLSPGSTIDISTQPFDDDFVQKLMRGDLDLAIVNEPFQPEDLRIAPLVSTDMVCLVGNHHELAGTSAISLRQYLELDHITPTRSSFGPAGPVDSKLHALGLARRIKVSVPEFGVIPYVLAQSNLVFTTGRLFARHLAGILPFSIFDAPAELGKFKFQMLWHERQHRSAANKWLRDLIRDVAADINRAELGRTERYPAIASSSHRSAIGSGAMR